MSKRIVCVDIHAVLGSLIYQSKQCLTADAEEAFAREYLASSYASKFNDATESDQERETATFTKWLQDENICYHTNVRLASPPDFSLTGMLLAEMRQHIRKLLGNMPGDYHQKGGFSGGATVDIKRGHHFTEKVGQVISCGPNNILDACYAVGVLSPNAEVVPFEYCRGAQVPKNNRINRMIAIEPTASVYLQKAIGSLIRSRLKRVGIDLDDQSINQFSAQKAFNDKLATIDLSSASDSVSFELVRQVIPADWFRELMKHRSPQMSWKGRLFTLNKFSSMGNGYTFELESLIFWALCKSVCRSDYINVYGDDIIVTQDDANSVVNGLTMIGFRVNHEKSFTSGDFFESCGKHFFRGHDVTPCYQKEHIDSPAAAMRAHNRLIRWALRGPASRFDIIGTACHILRSQFGHRDCAIPYGVQRDDGWLTHPESPDLVIDANGDFFCSVLCETRRLRLLSDDCQAIALNYKLAHPHHLNESPDGYVGKPTSPRTRVRKVVIWRSSIT